MHQQATIAAASTTGRDLSECLHLVNQFSQFANLVLGIPLQSLTHPEEAQTSIEEEANALIPEVDEESTLGLTGGALRMARVINMCRCLIRTRHSDAPQIAFWQDRLTETWADLNELIRTRWVQLIYAVRRQTYLARCEELHGFIREKATQFPDDVGADFKIICQQVSQQNAFEQDFQATELQVQMINQTAEQLLPLYAGKWTVRLTKPRDNLIGLVNELRTRMQRRRKRLEEAITLHRWLITVNEIVRWIQNTRTEVDHMLCPEENSEITRAEIGCMWSTESIRASLALLLHYRTEMNARKESILSCLRSGEQLYHAFINQSKETYESMQTSNPRRPTPIIVIDNQLDMNSNEVPTSPDSLLSRPTVGEDPQTISAERDEHKVLESRHRRNSSRADSSSRKERPSSSSTRCSEIKSDQSVTGSDDLTDDETIDHENKGPEAPESGFVVFNSDLFPLSPSPLPLTAQTPSAPVFGSSNEVKRNMIDIITRWCELQQFWCEVYKRLKFRLCAASFAS
ncbi:hypothetical protein FGIG_04826 [Fasciola gigantica]|uniref:Uncharacterized protein n=1 Tax=Fasciola gigantica TaxID=46835 RepID=A0A504YQU4_FASGI|nr:hypothetical protein FGIG_04826 [Fasciola gigantica]